MSTVSDAQAAPKSQLQFTVDLSRVVLFLAVVSLTLLAGFAGAYLVKVQAPAVPVQPSVPNLIPAPLPFCPGGCSKPSFKPFNVACPYCKNVITVQPSATGSTPSVDAAKGTTVSK